MGDEVARRREAAAWWCAERLSRLLERDERSVVWGDLVESGVGPRRALVEIAGLIARRQAALWLEWRRWIALATVGVPLGVLLSYTTRWWADASATLIAPYAGVVGPHFATSSKAPRMPMSVLDASVCRLCLSMRRETAEARNRGERYWIR